jgi:predicted methyltransferase
MAQRTEIRVGQQLIRWDGTRGYVALNSQGTRVFGRGESFLVEWLGLDGTVEDAEYLTVEACEQAGVALEEFPDVLTRYTPEEHACIERCQEERRTEHEPDDQWGWW